MASPTYEQVLDQIKKLEEKAETLREKEIASVIADVKEKIKKYDLKPSDLGFTGVTSRRGKKKASARKRSGSNLVIEPGKYKHPETGEVITVKGVGRKPKWLTSMTQAEINAARVK